MQMRRAYRISTVCTVGSAHQTTAAFGWAGHNLKKLKCLKNSSYFYDELEHG